MTATPVEASSSVSVFRPSLSAVVVSHNEGTNLEETIHSLLATMPRDAELLVVDDCSTDESATGLNARYPTARVVRTPRRLGTSSARNLGGREASGDVIVFCDAHIRPPVGWFETLNEPLQRPKVGAVGPGVSVMGNEALRGYGMTLKDSGLNIRWLPQASADPYPVPILGGFFFAMRRDVLQESGGFDDGLVGWGGNDVELSIRLWMLGYECVVVPSVHVAHLFRSRFPYVLPAEAVVHNFLRIGCVHFNEPRLARLVDRLSQQNRFGEALARFVAGDGWRRREEVRLRRLYDDDWFCSRFGIDVFDQRKKEDS